MGTGQSYFYGETLDDVMRYALTAVQKHGHRISPSRGDASELTGVLLEITNPRARLSRTETKGTPFSCLGELCWYLARSKSLDFISYYIPRYKKEAEGGQIYGAYGPRLFDWKNVNQFDEVVSILRRSDSRRAVIQLFDAEDLLGEHPLVPCTCTLQFLKRSGKVHLMVNMRSNDAYLGFPHDVFCFSMLQEIIARTVSADLGVYKHAVGSFHLYDEDLENALNFLGEGWQTTNVQMPSMPERDPQQGIDVLLKAEMQIRQSGTFDSANFSEIDPYWADLIRLLQIYRYKKKDKAIDKVRDVRENVSSEIYLPFIDA